jgi:hypothetical protein
VVAKEDSIQRRSLLCAGLLISSLALAGAGIGNGIDNIVSHAHGQDWTVSAGGSLPGVGATPVLVAVLLRRRIARWWSFVLVVVGAILAGYAWVAALAIS